MGWAERARRAGHIAAAPAASPKHVPPHECEEIRRAAWRFVRTRSALPRRLKRDQASAMANQEIARLEAQREQASHLVQPAAGGLVVPRHSLLITPEEARRMAQRR